MSEGIVMLKMLRNKWVPDFLDVAVPPKHTAKIDFGGKIWIIEMRFDLPMWMRMYSDGEGIVMNLHPEGLMAKYEEELIGYAKFLFFTIPIYRLKRKKPLFKRLSPLECDSIVLTNENDEPATIGIYMIHPPDLSLKNIKIKHEELREEEPSEK